MIKMEVTCTDCSEGGRVPKHKRREPVSVEKEVPEYLCAAVVLALHSAHEGHALRIVADGVQFFP